MTTTRRRPTILTFMDYYLPGYKAGGPPRTLSALVEQFADELDFRIITHDHDLFDNRVYEGIRQNEWQPVGSAQVFYATQRRFWPRLVYDMVQRERYDVVYMNSFFSPAMTIPLLFMRRMRMVRRPPLILGPRGELTKGALAIRTPKKRTYLALSRALGEYNDVIWQASSEYEAEDIRRELAPWKREPEIFVAPDLVPPPSETSIAEQRPPKRPGVLRVLYLSRIHRIKNLGAVLRAVAALASCGAVSLDIFGPVMDPTYWEQCQAAIATMPTSITITVHGPIMPALVPETMARFDIFVLPTHGENFGHVILEALAAGIPVLISDRTAFRDLAATGAGWDVPLEQPDEMVARLREMCAMDEPAHAAMRAAARATAARVRADPVAVDQNRALFQRVIELSRRGV